MPLTAAPVAARIDRGPGQTPGQTPDQSPGAEGALTGAVMSSPKLVILALTLFAPHAGELATAMARLAQIPVLRTTVLAGLGLAAAIGCGAFLAIVLVALLTRLLGGAYPDRAEAMELVASWRRAGVPPMRPTLPTAGAGRTSTPRPSRHRPTARRPWLSGTA